MPMIESQDVKVTVVVEVDGHTLRFEETGRVSGARYDGRATGGYRPGTTLEHNVRGTVDTQLARAGKRALRFVENAYPVAADQTNTQDERGGR